MLASDDVINLTIFHFMHEPVFRGKYYVEKNMTILVF